MRKLLTTLAAAFTLLVPAGSAVHADGQTVLEFETMAPVSGPFVGTANPVRGVPGGGIPWVIGSGQGALSSDGRLEVEVQGLVLATTHINPVANFQAVVSCLSIDSTGAPITVNVHTGSFAASTQGDSQIEATVSLPSPCIAPIVFVTSPAGTNPTGRWFATTGQS